MDAGHFQIEMHLLSYHHDQHNPARDGTHVRTWSVAPMNLKVGLLNSVDLQLVLLGLTYALTKNLRLDAGINLGVTRAADDWHPFVGLSYRF